MTVLFSSDSFKLHRKFLENCKAIEQLIPRNLYQDILGQTLILHRSLQLFYHKGIQIINKLDDKVNQDHYKNSISYSFNLIYKTSRDEDVRDIRVQR